VGLRARDADRRRETGDACRSPTVAPRRFRTRTPAPEGQLAGLIQAGVTVGQWPAGTDAELEARLITATLHGMMAQWHLTPGSFSWDAVADALTRD
jgi:hypothetical protein